VLTWEWDPNYPIRSPLLVIVVSVYYWILKVTGLDYSFMVAYGVRYLMVVPLTVAFDYHLVLLMRLVFPKYKRSMFLYMIVILFNSSNEFTVKYMTRSLYNTFECILNGITIYWWFKSEQYFLNRRYKDSLKWEIICRVFTTINFMIRSSCLIIWPISYLIRMVTRLTTDHKPTYLNKQSLNRTSSLVSLITINAVHMLMSNLIPFILDLLYFKTWNYTTYNFVKWNIIDGRCK